MLDDIHEILKLYNADPSGYIDHLPNLIESANILMDLLKLKPNDQELKSLIMGDAYIEPKHIIASTYAINERLALLNMMWLSGEFGPGTIMAYYRSTYSLNDVTDNFNLNAHCILLGNLISKVVTNNVCIRKTLTTPNILAIAPAIVDFSNNTDRIEKRNLAALLVLHVIIDSIKDLFSTEANATNGNNIITSLNKIAEYIYGPRKDTIMDIARTLEVREDIHYWQACLYDNSLESKEHSTCDLPLL